MGPVRLFLLAMLLAQAALSAPPTADSTGSTTGRAPGAPAAATVNILDYGAKCDGVTDDSAAIQAAAT